jgi:twitching motility protein PilT
VAAIDSLLKLAQQQGANELRLAVDQPPQMFAHGTPKRLSAPATSEQTLRVLLDSILSSEVERALHEHGSSETSYLAGALGSYRVAFNARSGGGFAVVFTEGAPVVPAPAPAATPAPARSQPPLEAARAPVQASPPAAAPAAPIAAVEGRVARASSQLIEWLQRAAAARASDLHLAEGEYPCQRVDGVLERLSDQIIQDLPAVLPLDPTQAARLAGGGSVDTMIEVGGVGRVRVHVYGTDAGPVAALRLLLRAAPSFSSLNMPTAFDDLIDLPHGLVLVCGAAGSGKSTTLAALAQEALHRRSLVLVTLEDPIEYVLTPSESSLVRRRQIGRDVKDFAAGLRDALRADPDMLLIGEIRDAETTALALTAAETGHLVLASLHSRSSASAIERIVDVCPPEQQPQVRIQLAESLRAVVSQRLLRRRHGTGRIPAIELLRVNRAVASLIRDGKTAQIASVLQSSYRDGMVVLERSLADRVQAGEIEVEDAYAAANDPETLSIFLKR